MDHAWIISEVEAGVYTIANADSGRLLYADDGDDEESTVGARRTSDGGSDLWMLFSGDPNNDGIDPMGNALRLTSAEARYCGYGIGKAIADAIWYERPTPKYEVATETSSMMEHGQGRSRWEPGEDRFIDDANIMAELEALPEVSGKSRIFFRFDPGQGDIEVLSWSGLGVTSDLALRIWAPNTEVGSEDATWLDSVGVHAATSGVRAIVEVGGPEEQGSEVKIRAFMKDLFMSDRSKAIGGLFGIAGITKRAVGLLKKAGNSEAVVHLKMRFLILSDGTVQGCMGTCCRGSVHIGHLEVVNQKFLTWVINQAKGSIGGFIPELLGHILPNLIQPALKLVLGTDFVPPADSNSALTIRIRVGHKVEEDKLWIEVIPSDAAIQASWKGVGSPDSAVSVSVGPGTLLKVVPDALVPLLQPVLGPILQRCGLGLMPGCRKPLTVPVELDVNPSDMKLHLRNLRVSNGLASTALLGAELVAQPSGCERLGGCAASVEEYCLANLDSKLPALRRAPEEFTPFAREPRFGVPADLMSLLSSLSSKMSVNVEGASGKGGHSVALNLSAHVGIGDIGGMLRPFLNDPAVVDTGFLYFGAERGQGFIRRKNNGLKAQVLGPLVETVKQVDVQCGSLLLDGLEKVDLAGGASIEANRENDDDELHCFNVVKPKSAGKQKAYVVKPKGAGKQKAYRLCSLEEEKSSALRQIIQKEIDRLSAFEQHVRTDGCLLPDSDVVHTILAKPPKAFAFHWQPSRLDAPPYVSASQDKGRGIFKLKVLEKCLGLCAQNPACRAVGSRPQGGCTYISDQELILLGGTPQDPRPTWQKQWMI